MSATTITVVGGLLAFVGISVAAVGYVERSSDAAFAEFMSANELSVSEVDRSEEPLAPVQSQNGRTGCPVGKKELPTQLIRFAEDRP